MTTDIDTWIAHAEKQIAAAYNILGTAKIAIGPRGAGDVKVLAATLLARSAGNMKGVIAMARAGLVIEARTIGRCIFENEFWLAGLVTEGEAFADRMRDDEIKSRQLRAQFLMESATSRASMEEATSDRLRRMLKETKDRWPDAAMLTPKQVAGVTPMRDAYMFYSQLSADAAHPSVQALSRHVVSLEENGERIRGIDAFPPVKAGEIEDALNLACLAMLGCCVCTNQLLEDPLRGQVLNPLADEYLRLSDIGKKAA